MSQKHVNLVIFNEFSEIPVERLDYLLNKYFSDQLFQFMDSETVMTNKDLIHCLPNRVDKELRFDSPLFEYSEIAKYENIILVSDNKSDLVFESEEFKMLKLTALYYKIFFGKTICLVSSWEKNDEGARWGYHNQRIEYYPFPYFTWFLNLAESGDDEEIDLRKFDEKSIETPKMFEPCLKGEAAMDKLEEDRNRSKEEIFTINEDANFIKNCRFIFERVEKGIKLEEFKKIAKSKNNNYFKLFENFVSNKQFLFYNAAFLSQESLVKNIQISLPKPGDKAIFIFKNATVEDFVFRNLKYDNVCVRHENNLHFILPYYKVDQYTRQTLRFLIMFLYHVDHSSTLVDYIAIYLCIKFTNLPGVTGLDKNMLETRLANIANIFLNREVKDDLKLRNHILTADKIESLERLKFWFPELKELEHEDIHEIFKQFLNTRTATIPGNLMTVEIVNCKENTIDLKSTIDENIEKLFKEDRNQSKPIELSPDSWPVNKNYTLSQENFFQINTSRPIYICCKNLAQFEEKLTEYAWLKHIPKGFVLKGGAVIDLLCDRKPKDFDFVSINLSNSEYLKGVVNFCKKTRATDIDLNILRPDKIIKLAVIRLKVNDDILEFVNSNFSETEVLRSEYMPDQIVYNSNSKKMICNEFTLFSLNYGYVELPVDKQPGVLRMSKYMNKGFSFYINGKHFNDKKADVLASSKIEDTLKSFKSLLERDIWVIWMTDPKKSVSFESKNDKTEKEKTVAYSVGADNNLYKDKTCRVFPTVDDYIKFVSESKLNEFTGAVVLPTDGHKAMRNPEFLNLFY